MDKCKYCGSYNTSKQQIGKQVIITCHNCKKLSSYRTWIIKEAN